MARSITKIDRSIFTAPSRRFAAWAIPHLPAWVTPNQVTCFGFAMMLLAGAALALARIDRAWLLAAAACVLVHWLADDLDGELARARDLTSERGFFLDLFLDCLGAVALSAGLALSGLASPVLALAFLSCFLLAVCVSLLHIVLRGRFPLGSFGPSETQIGMAALCGLVYLWPWADVLGWRVALFDLALLATIVINVVDWGIAIGRLWAELEGPRR